MLHKVRDVLFWLAVSIYFGGILTLGIVVAPAVFATAKAQHIVLPGVMPPLDPATQAGGEIFGAILQRFSYVEGACVVVILGVIAARLATKTSRRAGAWALAMLAVTLACIASYDVLILTPEVVRVRQAVRETAAAHVQDGPGAAWSERSKFDALHKRSETMGHIKALLLLGMVGVAVGSQVGAQGGRK
jgi:hypothetical protein